MRPRLACALTMLAHAALLTGCASVGVGFSLPIGRAAGVGVSVGSDGQLGVGVGVGSGNVNVGVGGSVGLPKSPDAPASSPLR